MLVVVNGGYRTGSTWVFNIARKVCELFGEYQSIGADEEFIRERIGLNWVVKCHVFHDFSDIDGFKILYTVRNSFDKESSAKRIGGFNHGMHEDGLDREIQYQSCKNAFVIAYDRYIYEPGLLIKHIGKFLFDVDLEEDQIKSIFLETSIDAHKKISSEINEGGFDLDTQLRPNHIVSPYPGSYRIDNENN